MLCYAMKWYFNTFSNLPIGKIYHSIAKKGVTSMENLRQFEKVTIKLSDHKLHLQYFDKCLELNLIPNFLKFKPPNLEIYQNPNIYYRKALIEQKKNVASKLREVKHEHDNLMCTLASQLSVFQFRLLMYCMKTQVLQKTETKKARTHNAKLYKLWKEQRPSTPDCIVNLSTKQLSLSEHNALLFGLNHHILPKKINPLSIKAEIENQINKICLKNNISLSFDSKNTIREATDRFAHDAESLCNTKKNKSLHNTLRKLANNNQVKICKMDKSNGIVLMNSEDYYNKMDYIINDKSRFTHIEYNIKTNNIQDCSSAPWIIKENSVANYCRKYLKPIVDDKTYWYILPRGSQPGKLYGTAKHHKAACPMRPVLSAIKTPEYNLAKWLETQIKPFLVNKFSVTSSSTFVDELSTLKPVPSDQCVSFDIKSLYTHVPLREVVNDISDTIFSKTAKPSIFTNHPSKITRTVFKNILTLCSEPVFIYNDKVYQQCDGVAMGSPLAPLLADWFVSTIENKILQQQHLPCKPKFYRRYVDDVFCLFDSDTSRDCFFKTLNEAHPNLEFTMETTTKYLPFLDISISINNGNFQTEVFRKKTNTNVLLNYNSTAPLKWKKGLIRCLLVRAHRICSNMTLFTSELSNIRRILQRNSYPCAFINNIIDDFVSTHDIKEENYRKNQQTITQPKTMHSDLTEVFFTIPWLGISSAKFQRRIQQQMREYDIAIKAAYTTTKVGAVFSLKSKCSRLFDSNVVYKFSCFCDKNISYLGETRRQLFRRIMDHTTQDRTNCNNSAVLDHLYQCQTCQNVPNIADSFSILQHCSSNNILSYEALLISKHLPKLNIQMGASQGKLTTLNLYS